MGVLWELLFDDVVFDEECVKELVFFLEEWFNFSCFWDVSIWGGYVVKGKKRKLDIVEIFFIFVWMWGFCLIDLFRMLVKDGNVMSILKIEFIVGMKKFNVLFKDY